MVLIFSNIYLLYIYCGNSICFSTVCSSKHFIFSVPFLFPHPIIASYFVSNTDPLPPLFVNSLFGNTIFLWPSFQTFLFKPRLPYFGHKSFTRKWNNQKSGFAKKFLSIYCHLNYSNFISHWGVLPTTFLMKK